MPEDARSTGTSIERMRDWIRYRGREHLRDPNITSVGIGWKEVGGERTDIVSLQFTVRRKLTPAELEDASTHPLPDRIRVDAADVLTDVVQRSFIPAFEVVPEAFDDLRTRRMDPLRPGVSVSHPSVSAGTAGAIVHDRRTGEPVLLSNWHVLHGPEGAIGDDVLQPGTHDDNSGDPRNVIGRLLRSHLGAAGDGALASLDRRSADPSILGMDVVPDQIGDPQLGDQVVKSGRTTAVTHGVVCRIHTLVSLDYGDGTGVKAIGGFEIEPDPRRADEQRVLSDGGDSGAVWMFKHGNGHTSTVMGGLHFAAAVGVEGGERALANYASSLRTRLDFSLSATSAEEESADRARTAGYDPHFLAHPVPLPELTAAQREDAAAVDGDPLIPYTHFSLVQSASRRLARFVAWNIDGAHGQRISRDGIDFRLEYRLPPDVQAGEDLYRSNDLDRGHIARRADLTWGAREEARQANEDSFCFTNIAPQMSHFNQSGRGGVWGEVENSLFEQVEVQQLRVSVIGGPVFADDDREYRGVQLPAAYFKAVYYVHADELQVRSFLLAQDLAGMELLDFSRFSTHLVGLAELSERTGLTFPRAVERPGSRRPDAGLESVGTVRLESTEQIPW